MYETGLTPAPTVPPATAIEALRSVPWLGDVAAATMERLAGHAMVIRLPKGAQIFDQAEVPSFAQFLLEFERRELQQAHGLLQTRRQRQMLASL